MPIIIELTASNTGLDVMFVRIVPTRAIPKPSVAAKSSTTIAINGPSVDSLRSLKTDKSLLTALLLSSFTALYRT